MMKLLLIFVSVYFCVYNKVVFADNTAIISQTLQYAKLSESVYDIPANVQINNKVYKVSDVIKPIDYPVGISAVVYESDNEIVVAFRGTSEKPMTTDELGRVTNDWVTNLSLMGGENTQLEIARKFGEQVINEPRFKNKQVTFTGHSLGGALAQYATFYNQDSTNSQREVSAITYNSAPLPLSMKDRELDNIINIRRKGDPLSGFIKGFINTLDFSNSQNSYYSLGRDIVLGMGECGILQCHGMDGILDYYRDQIRDNSTEKDQSKKTQYHAFITEVQANRNLDITQDPNLVRISGGEDSSVAISSSETDIQHKSENIMQQGFEEGLPSYAKNPNTISQINAKFQKTGCLTYTCWGRWSEDVVVNDNALDTTKEINIKSGWVVGQIDPNVTQYLQKTGTVSYAGNIVGQGGRMTTVGSNSATGRYTGDITGTFNLQANINGGYNNQMSGTMNMTNTSTNVTTKANIENTNIHNNGTFTGGVRITEQGGQSITHNGTGRIQGGIAGSEANKVFGSFETTQIQQQSQNHKVEDIMVGTFAGTKQ